MAPDYPRGVTSALLSYRVMAYATGVLLVVLGLVAVPLKYLGPKDARLVEAVGPLHGWLYFLYVVTALVLAYRSRWGAGKTLLVVVAGTVPFASFLAERRVVRDARAEERAAVGRAG